jgi:hypothetical protein
MKGPEYNEMSTKVEHRTYEDALSWLREHGFDLLEAPGTQGRVFLKKYNVSAAIQKNGDDGVKIFAYPGYLIGSEISKLVNRGYQQFLKTAKTEVPATADHLKALQQFTEELKEGLGLPSLYNESLGTVSESYQYDRVVDRDKPAAEKPKRPRVKHSQNPPCHSQSPQLCDTGARRRMRCEPSQSR